MNSQRTAPLARRALICASLASFLAAFAASDVARVPQAGLPAPMPAEAIREDLRYLYEHLQEAHYDLYAHRSKDDYDAYYRRVSASVDQPMSRPDLVRLVQRFMAYGMVTHSRIDAHIDEFMKFLKGGGPMLPLFMRVKDGHAYLQRAASFDGKLPPGTEIVRVDGEPVLAWLNRLAEYISAERPYMTYAQLEGLMPVAVWLAFGERKSVQVTARGAAGGVFDAEVDALPYEDLKKRFPPASFGTDFKSREVRIIGNHIAYLRPGPFYNTEQTSGGPAPSYEDSAYRKFIDDAFERIIASGATDLILDLRNNPGGDNSFSDPMVAWFANKPFRFASRFTLKASSTTKTYYEKLKADDKQGAATDAILARLMAAEAAQPNGTRYSFDLPLTQPREGKRYLGRVFVLVNRHSYSNATTTAALIQDYGFGKIMGEESADLPTSYASVVYFDLPNSGITVTYPKSYFVRPNGNESVKGVVPDYPIPDPISPGQSDVMLKEAVQLVKSLRAVTR